MDNDALNSVDQLERAVRAALDGLRGLAPAAIQDGVRGHDPRGPGALVLRMTRTRTLSAVLVWLRASERISVSDLGMGSLGFLQSAVLSSTRDARPSPLAGNRVAH
jgi:hypothetical protein